MKDISVTIPRNGAPAATKSVASTTTTGVEQTPVQMGIDYVALSAALIAAGAFPAPTHVPDTTPAPVQAAPAPAPAPVFDVDATAKMVADKLGLEGMRADQAAIREALQGLKDNGKLSSPAEDGKYFSECGRLASLHAAEWARDRPAPIAQLLNDRGVPMISGHISLTRLAATGAVVIVLCALGYGLVQLTLVGAKWVATQLGV